ncbi:MAG TPA: glycosyltransferase family 39 protein [Thermoanaerobaculia bacterium]
MRYADDPHAIQPKESAAACVADRAETSPFASQLSVVVLGCSILLLAAGWLWVVLSTPGFFADESSIALNAWLIATTGADEHGVRWPLYFRAFGEWKNPPLIYLLTGVFRVVGPSIVAARVTSLACVLAAVVAAALFSYRLGGRSAALPAAALAISFPWWIDLSRLVFEVALNPLATVLLAWSTWEAGRVRRFSPGRGLFLGASLALMTYVYTTGRMLGPVAALLVALLLSKRGKWWNFTVIGGLVSYAIASIPILVFSMTNQGALTSRFRGLRAAADDTTAAGVIVRAISEANLAFWLVDGDPISRHHLSGMGTIAVGMAMLILCGLIAAWSRRHDDRWYLFIVLFTPLAIVPCALTPNIHHALRLSTYGTLLLVLAITGWIYFSGRLRSWIQILLLSTIVGQGFWYAWSVASFTGRTNDFDVSLQQALASALDLGETIWIESSEWSSMLVHARWYAVAWRLEPDRIRIENVELMPQGAAVLTHASRSGGWPLVLERSGWTVRRQITAALTLPDSAHSSDFDRTSNTTGAETE